MTDSIETATAAGEKRRAIWPWLLGAIALLGVFVYAKMGLYSIQPIGALPEGATALVWRSQDEPFFNSADGLCLERVGHVSLLCRAMAAREAPTDRIVIRLPYQRWAYLKSTGGREFDR